MLKDFIGAEVDVNGPRDIFPDAGVLAWPIQSVKMMHKQQADRSTYFLLFFRVGRASEESEAELSFLRMPLEVGGVFSDTSESLTGAGGMGEEGKRDKV